MPWRFPKSMGSRQRPQAHPDEVLHAIDAALKDNPVETEISAQQLAPLVKRHIAIQEPQIIRFIQKKMTSEQRAARKIVEPRSHVRPVDTLINKP